jgi:hypothetical protein
METPRWIFNLDLMIKYEVLGSGVIRLTFINGDIFLIEESDEKTKSIFMTYMSGKKLF